MDSAVVDLAAVAAAPLCWVVPTPAEAIASRKLSVPRSSGHLTTRRRKSSATRDRASFTAAADRLDRSFVDTRNAKCLPALTTSVAIPVTGETHAV